MVAVALKENKKETQMKQVFHGLYYKITLYLEKYKSKPAVLINSLAKSLKQKKTADVTLNVKFGLLYVLHEFSFNNVDFRNHLFKTDRLRILNRNNSLTVFLDQNGLKC